MYEIYFQVYYGTHILNIHKIVDDDFILIVQKYTYTHICMYAGINIHTYTIAIKYFRGQIPFLSI